MGTTLIQHLPPSRELRSPMKELGSREESQSHEVGSQMGNVPFFLHCFLMMPVITHVIDVCEGRRGMHSQNPLSPSNAN